MVLEQCMKAKEVLHNDTKCTKVFASEDTEFNEGREGIHYRDTKWASQGSPLRIRR